MNEEIQEIDRLIKQTGELSDCLIRLTRKLQEQQAGIYVQRGQEWSERLAAVRNKLTDLAACSGILIHEIDQERQRHQHQAYVNARVAVTNGSSTPQEAVIELLRTSVADQKMSPDSAAEQLVKLLRPDLPASRKIEIRESARAAFEAGDDVISKVRPFLKAGQHHAEHSRDSNKQAVRQRV